MHIFFSGIGGTGIGPLALIAHQAGYAVSGSDKQDSQYIHYLKSHGIQDITIGQSYDDIATVHRRRSIDWLVYSSAVAIERPDAPEFTFCQDHGIKMTTRSDLLNTILTEKKLKLVAIAGTHGKTTTTAMLVWLMKQLAIPISYSVGAKLSFGEMGEFTADSEYFVYEADEFARNFLAFEPYLSLITGVDYDHADIYPTREDYQQAFRDFIAQSAQTIAWNDDVRLLGIAPDSVAQLSRGDPHIVTIDLPGLVNRYDAWQVVQAAHVLTGKPLDELAERIQKFPGVARRFEQIAPHLFSDYAHTPPKIRGALQLAQEVGEKDVVVVYEGLHNTRQHFIKDELVHLFDDVAQVYIVPSYLAREDPNLALLSPADLVDLLSPESQTHAQPAHLNDDLKLAIAAHVSKGDTVLALSAGGGGSLDEWLRTNFQLHHWGLLS